jgi:hypothetical protein
MQKITDFSMLDIWGSMLNFSHPFGCIRIRCISKCCIDQKHRKKPGEMRSRNWIFVINNYDEDELDFHEKWNGVKYLAWQREIGESGNNHIQGYVCFNNAISLTGAKSRHETAHWEIRQGTHEQALAYATKEDTRKEGTEPFIWGTPPSQGQRSDLQSVRALIDDGGSMLDVAEANFGAFVRYHRAFQFYQLLRRPQRAEKTKVLIYYGEPGTGKSRKCFEDHPNAYWKPHGKWWDGYQGQDVVVIDDFYGWIPYSQMLNLMDRYPLNVETKGGTVNFTAKILVITSNKVPTNWYPNRS